MSKLNDYLTEVGELSADTVLGWIVMWQVVDFEPGITPTALGGLFLKHDLDLDMLPPDPKSFDAFRKTTSKIKREIVKDDEVISFLSRAVKSDSNYVERAIVRESLDPETRQLRYAKAISAVFYRPLQDPGSRQTRTASARVRFTCHPDNYPAEETDFVEDLANAMRNQYAAMEAHVDGQRIRTLIRDYVRHLDALQLRAATWFVDRDHADELARFAAMVNELPGRCRMHMLPLVDLPAARDMLVDSFQAEAADELARIVKRCAELRDKGKVTPEQFASVRAEYDQVERLAASYMQTLETNQDLTGANAELARKALADLTRVMLNGEEDQA